MTTCGHSVYVAFDEHKDCLYVGRTSVGERRMRQHGKASQWWQSVHHIIVHHFGTRAEAALFEFEFIKGYRPEFNIEVPSNLQWPLGRSEEDRAQFERRYPGVLRREVVRS